MKKLMFVSCFLFPLFFQTHVFAKTKVFQMEKQAMFTLEMRSFQTNRRLNSTRTYKKSPLVSTLIQHQATSVDLGSIVLAAILTTSVEVILIGNVASFIAKRSQFGWGLAGTITGGLGVLGGLIFLADTSTLSLGLTSLISSGTLLAFGIMNMIAKPDDKIALAPWLHLDRVGRVGGGLSLSGRW